jgi:hypothetical protein
LEVIVLIEAHRVFVCFARGLVSNSIGIRGTIIEVSAPVLAGIFFAIRKPDEMKSGNPQTKRGGG